MIYMPDMTVTKVFLAKPATVNEAGVQKQRAFLRSMRARGLRKKLAHGFPFICANQGVIATVAAQP